MKITVSLGVNEEHIVDWKDTSDEKIPVKYMNLNTWDNVRGSMKIRNIRNPDKPTELCVNNVGSFQCASTAEEYVAIGFGGHTTCGSSSCYIKQFREAEGLTNISLYLFFPNNETIDCNDDV